LDVFTLFAANAIILLVMAGGFVAAWLRQAEEYWLTWMAANVALAAALLLFMFMPDGTARTSVLPHCLLVFGFGLRWRAASQFTGERCAWVPVLLPLGATAILFAAPAVFSAGLVFVVVNVLLAGLAGATAFHFWRRREHTSLSSYGLVFSYGVMALSFAARVVEGLAFLDEFTSYLPHDWMLRLHLLVAVVHTSSSGAFALSIAYERAAVHLRRERDLAQSRAQVLGQLAERDELTGLMNRRAIEPRFSELRKAGFNTVAVLDLDHFKAVNDRHGHGTGDEALRAAARALSPDADCLVARLGGEEFMLVLRGKDARRRAEERRQAIGECIAADVPGLDRPVTASMGVIELPRHELAELGFEQLYSIADRLLYEAKAGGRNRTVTEKMTLFGKAPRKLEPVPLMG
jgi:diguanylate cyclase (GGDEF)-like protein